ncbi:poly-gamma-glutamate hydrolase family protein [Priestia megaterium]|uniref:poly-gamma-glutamate hydrolase family protein n=1 Tax=Priestia megaterium TaxID=1404 RepID=UPI00211C5746|nr:poly-gamma-glutamate hydrolase family protein [Priestia megaterium]
MPDLYPSMTALKAATVEGVDWQIVTVSNPKSSTIVTAIHGGGIEIGTSELAMLVQEQGNYNTFRFEGLRSSNNSELHVTSTNYDDPTILSMLPNMERNISIHGAAGTTPVVYIGGLDYALRNAIWEELTKRGIAAEVPPAGIVGEEPLNVSNRSKTGKAVQLELTTAMRQSFFVNGDWSRSARTNRNNWTQVIYDFADAILTAIANSYSSYKMDSKTTYKMDFYGNLDYGKRSKAELSEDNKNYADNLKSQTDQEIQAVQQDLDDLNLYVDGSFQDGVIEQAEAKAIEKYLNDLNARKMDSDQRYNEVFNNTLLTGTPKTNLSSAKTAFNTAHTNLINSINTAITDGKTTSAEKADVDAKFVTYRTELGDLAVAFEEAIDAIAQAKSDAAETNAKNYADTLKTAIDSDISGVSQDVTDLNNYVDGSFRDGVVDESESIATSKLIKDLESTKAQLDQRYSQIYSNVLLTGTPKSNLSTAKTNFDTAHTNLINSINAAISDNVITSTEQTDIDSKFTSYKTELGDLATAFEAAIDAIAQQKADDAEQNAKDHADTNDTNLRTNLRLTAPLPTDITMDGNGITAGANQATSYARLDYRGLYIYGGAIQIDGGLPDGQISSASNWNSKETPSGAQAKADAAAKLAAGTGAHFYARQPLPLDSGTGNYANYDHSLTMQVTENIHLGSVSVYTDTAGTTGTIQLTLSDGTVLQTWNVTLPAVGENVISLDVLLKKDVGTYKLFGNFSGNTWRTTSGTTFPYDSGSFQITGTSSGTGYWYHFYNFSVGGQGVKGDIPSGVTVDGEFIETTTGAQAKIDAVQIGGRNIAKGTNFTSTTGYRLWGVGTLSAVTTDTYVGFNYIKQETRDASNNQLVVANNTAIGIRNIDAPFEVVGGKKYTVSMYVAASELGKMLDYIYLMHGDGGSNYSLPTIDMSTFPVVTPAYSGAPSIYDFHEVTFTFTADRSDKNAYMLIGGRTKRDLNGTDGYAWIRIGKLKVEQGTKRTDWTKAPEDIDQQIEDVDTQVREDLRLTAPLPTSLTMDGNGITASTSGTGYARLDYRGLYIYGGAIQIDGGLPDSEIASGTTWNNKTTLLDGTGLYTGTITFDQAEGGTLTLGGPSNGNGVMQVLDETGEVIADLDAGQGGFSSLYVANLDAPNVLGYSDENFNFYVSDRLLAYTGAIDPDDSNDGTGWTKPLRTVTEALRRIPKYYDGTATITIAYDSILYEDIKVKGFLGSGTIKIITSGSGVKLNGVVSFSGNLCDIYFQDMLVNGPSGSYAVLAVTQSSYVILSNLDVYGNTSDRGIDVRENSYSQIENCEVYNVADGICSRYGASAWVYNCKGLATANGLRAYGGDITGYGTAPAGPDSTKNATAQYGGTISSHTADSGAATPPAPPETTSTWSSTGGDSWRDNFGGQWYGQNEVVQGYWGGYGVYEGLWIFGSSPSTAVTGKTIKSMRLKVTRKSAGGNSGAVTCYFRPHTYTSIPAGDPTFLNASTTATFKWGESKWITIPSSFYSYFQSGSAKGVGIYIESTSGSYYAKFTTSATLEITYA